MASPSDEILTDELVYFDQDSNPETQQQQEELADEEDYDNEGLDGEGNSKKRKRRRSKNINVRTLFVSGLPLDAKAREIHLLFIGFKGFKGSFLKQAMKDGVECNPVAFVMFEKREQAEVAKNGVNGIKFDPDHSSTIKVDYAKANTKSTKSHKAKRVHNNEECETLSVHSPPPHTYPPSTYPHPGPVSMTATGVYGGFEMWQHGNGGGGTSYIGDIKHHTTTYSDRMLHHCHFTNHNNHIQPQHHMLPYPPQLLAPPSFGMVHPPPPPPPTSVMLPPPIQPPPPPGPMACEVRTHTPANKEKKWTTLFVGNIPKDVKEDELEELFSRIPSFRRLKAVRNKDASTVAFVQYKDHISAGQAKNLFHGQTLGGGNNGGIRIEFAKTPMIEGTVKLKDKT